MQANYQFKFPLIFYSLNYGHAVVCALICYPSLQAIRNLFLRLLFQHVEQFSSYEMLVINEVIVFSFSPLY